MTKDEALKLALEIMQYRGDVNMDEWIATEKAIKEALAQRTWVGLTGFEQKELMAMSARDAVFATEAKLKQKERLRQGEEHMTAKDKALKLALEIMQNLGDVSVDEWIAAEKAIREALAQPEPSELDVWKSRALQAEAVIEKFMAQPEQHQDWCASLTQMLASMPPQPAPCNCKPPQPEPVIDKSAAVRIATALGWEPKRTWRWLTDEEIYEAWDTIIEEPKQAIEFAYNIQAKLKEKNT